MSTLEMLWSICLFYGVSSYSYPFLFDSYEDNDQDNIKLFENENQIEYNNDNENVDEDKYNNYDERLIRNEKRIRNICEPKPQYNSFHCGHRNHTCEDPSPPIYVTRTNDKRAKIKCRAQKLHSVYHEIPKERLGTAIRAHCGSCMDRFIHDMIPFFERCDITEDVYHSCQTYLEEV